MLHPQKLSAHLLIVIVFSNILPTSENRSSVTNQTEINLWSTKNCVWDSVDTNRSQSQEFEALKTKDQVEHPLKILLTDQLLSLILSDILGPENKAAEKVDRSNITRPGILEANESPLCKVRKPLLKKIECVNVEEISKGNELGALVELTTYSCQSNRLTASDKDSENSRNCDLALSVLKRIGGTIGQQRSINTNSSSKKETAGKEQSNKTILKPTANGFSLKGANNYSVPDEQSINIFGPIREAIKELKKADRTLKSLLQNAHSKSPDKHRLFTEQLNEIDEEAWKQLIVLVGNSLTDDDSKQSYDLSTFLGKIKILSDIVNDAEKQLSSVIVEDPCRKCLGKLGNKIDFKDHLQKVSTMNEVEKELELLFHGDTQTVTENKTGAKTVNEGQLNKSSETGTTSASDHQSKLKKFMNRFKNLINDKELKNKKGDKLKTENNTTKDTLGKAGGIKSLMNNFKNLGGMENDREKRINEMLQESSLMYSTLPKKLRTFVDNHEIICDVPIQPPGSVLSSVSPESPAMSTIFSEEQRSTRGTKMFEVKNELVTTSTDSSTEPQPGLVANFVDKLKHFMAATRIPTTMADPFFENTTGKGSLEQVGVVGALVKRLRNLVGVISNQAKPDNASEVSVTSRQEEQSQSQQSLITISNREKEKIFESDLKSDLKSQLELIKVQDSTESKTEVVSDKQENYENLAIELLSKWRITKNETIENYENNVISEEKGRHFNDFNLETKGNMNGKIEVTDDNKAISMKGHGLKCETEANTKPEFDNNGTNEPNEESDFMFTISTHK